MNILIIGGAGYIGSHITEQLINKKLNQLLKWKTKYNDMNKIIKSAISWEKKL